MHRTADRPAPVDADVTILGAGPIGLYAAYCAGFRGLRAALIDTMPQVGGQIAALYPDKYVRDVAGIPALRGHELVTALQAQAEQFRPAMRLGRTARHIRSEPDRIQVELDDGSVVVSRRLLVTAGIGGFHPRRLAAGSAFDGRGVTYLVTDVEAFRDRTVVVVGGGDSALDWALAISEVTPHVTVVHRRAEFRAHRASVVQAVDRGIALRVRAEVIELQGADRLERAVIADADGRHLIELDDLVGALGFVSDLGPLLSWGLAMTGRHIAADQRMRTNVPGVYVAGDIAEYPGKVRLMSVGFGEAATAIGSIAVEVDPAATLFPGHSTDGSPTLTHGSLHKEVAR